MEYAAALSIRRSLNQLYHLSDKLTNIHCPVSYIKHLNEMAVSIQMFDYKEDRLAGTYLEKEIRDALWKAEDIIESYMLSRLLLLEDCDESPGDMSHGSDFSKDLFEVILEIESIKEKMDKFADDLKHGKENFISVSMSVNPSSDDLPPMHKNKMVGLDWDLEEMKNIILGERPVRHFLRLGAIIINGMCGIGKTSLAISIYNDLDFRRHFSIGAWVKVSLEPSVRNILLNLFYSMEFFDDGRMIWKIMNGVMIEEMNDEVMANFVRGIFMSLRYLVVVDCLCDINVTDWDYIKTILPDSNNGSRILLVSRFRLDTDPGFVFGHYTPGFLDDQQSWNLLQQQVFGDETCPDRVLEEIGRGIAKNCKGLPLAIITVGVHLSQEEKTVEYWNKVLESGNSIAYAADGAPMFEQLGLSYKQMPRRLRHIFLYMGVFPESQEFYLSELMNLWDAEVLFELEEFRTDENLFWQMLMYFLQRDLIIRLWNKDVELYTWSFHHALWHFCCNQAKREEFFHVFDECSCDGEYLDINIKLRRLVIREAVLFGIVEFIRKIEHSELSIRSMLFTGPYHPYPLTSILWDSYKMLRVLNARSIRLYEFPTEILYLKLLRYLALTLNGGALPPGISSLRNLESLIVGFHHIVRSCNGDPSYLPIEIWEMQQLSHLQVMGCDLPAPPHSDSLLPILTTLLDVTAHSCTKEVLERIPKLGVLKISINLAQERNSAPICLFDHSVLLAKLHSASFAITNPYFEENTGHQVVAMPESFPYSMKNLTFLRLSGCGFPWESIEPISHLPFLVHLELQSHAFRGHKWELKGMVFSKLQHLHLDDLDLVSWTTGSGDHFFPCLMVVTIMNCHRLEQIPQNLAHCQHLTRISVIDSSQSAENWARSIHTELSQTRKMQFIVTSQRGSFNIN